MNKNIGMTISLVNKEKLENFIQGILYNGR
jgi:hypothetical protein